MYSCPVPTRRGGVGLEELTRDAGGWTLKLARDECAKELWRSTFRVLVVCQLIFLFLS